MLANDSVYNPCLVNVKIVRLEHTFSRGSSRLFNPVSLNYRYKCVRFGVSGVYGLFCSNLGTHRPTLRFWFTATRD